MLKCLNDQGGQSLIELLIAIALFVVIVSTLSFLILDSYVAGRLGKEITQANFLAEEGLEAVRSIRDNDWNDLIADPEYGLDNSGGQWVFSEDPETIGKFTRVITVGNIGDDRKKITSKVTWQFSPDRPQNVTLVTYLTNWAKIMPYLAQSHYRWRTDDGLE